jgi:hypothetical protein
MKALIVKSLCLCVCSMLLIAIPGCKRQLSEREKRLVQLEESAKKDPSNKKLVSDLMIEYLDMELPDKAIGLYQEKKEMFNSDVQLQCYMDKLLTFYEQKKWDLVWNDFDFIFSSYMHVAIEYNDIDLIKKAYERMKPSIRQDWQWFENNYSYTLNRLSGKK